MIVLFIFVLLAEMWRSSSSPNQPLKAVDWFRFFKNYNKQSFITDLQQGPWHVVFDLSENIDCWVDIWNKLYFWTLLIHMRALSLEKLKILHFRPQSSSFLGRWQIKPSGSGHKNELWMNPTIAALMRNMTIILKKQKTTNLVITGACIVAWGTVSIVISLNITST